MSLRLLALFAAAAAYWGLAAVFSRAREPADRQPVPVPRRDARSPYRARALTAGPDHSAASPRGRRPGRCIRDRQLRLARSGSQYLQDWSRYVRAELGALEVAGAGTRSDFAPDPVRAPDITAGKYFAAIRDYGSPASTTAEIARAGEAERQAADSVLLQALGAAVVPDGVASSEPPAVELATNGQTATQDGCIRFTPSAAGAALDIGVPRSGSLSSPADQSSSGYVASPTDTRSNRSRRFRPARARCGSPARRGVQWHSRLERVRAVSGVLGRRLLGDGLRDTRVGSARPSGHLGARDLRCLACRLHLVGDEAGEA